MIHHTINFVAITTLYLVMVTFTLDIYTTDAVIWSQTETTTDRKDHSSGTAYQQIAATNTPESFSNLASTVHREKNVSLENLMPDFKTSIYIVNCSDLQEHTDADEFQFIPYDEEFPVEMIKTARKLYAQFNTLINTAVRFICTENTAVGYDVISMSRTYAHNCAEFVVRLNGSTVAIGEEAVLDTVADLCRPSIKHVESVMELIEYLIEMISEEDKSYEISQSIIQEFKVTNIFNSSSTIKIIIGKQKELVNLLQNILERVGNMSDHADGHPLINVIKSGTMSRFLNAQYWAELIEQQTEQLVKYENIMPDVQRYDFVMYTVVSVIVAIILVVGISGNGLLLTIFIRHKETRTLANSMLINLTVVDLLSMVVNVLLDYLFVISKWQLGWLGCKLHLYFGPTLVAVSTYSVAMISVQRFVAVRQLPSLAWCYQSQKTKYVLIAAVWGLGCILSGPHAVSDECYELSREIVGVLYTSDFITVCVVPLIITAVFSVLTAYRIRRSVREIPGEAAGRQQLQHSRMVSSTVLFALMALFVVSYPPFFLFNFLKSGIDISLHYWAFFWVYVITYHLRFLNCCLNPIFLFVTSKRYRRYIKKYCGQKEVQTAKRVEAA